MGIGSSWESRSETLEAEGASQEKIGIKCAPCKENCKGKTGVKRRFDALQILEPGRRNEASGISGS